MTKRPALLLSLVLCLLVVLICLKLNSIEDGNEAAATGTRQKAEHGEITEPDSDAPVKSKRDRSDAARAKSLSELEKEFDKMLPAKSPKQSSALYDANLKPGESLILGGFKTANGDYEFTTMQVDPADTSIGSDCYIIRTKTITMKPDKSRELGLGALLSPARMRIQKGIIRPAGDATLADSSVSVMSQPTLTSRAGQTATIQIGTEEIVEVTPGHFETVLKGHFVSVIADHGSDGQSARIRTRIESPEDRNGD